MLRERGAWIVDADAVAREVVEPGSEALAKLVERFGDSILAPDGSLDRPALGQLAFVNDETRKDLEAITHPAINQEFLRRMQAAPEGSIVVCDIPLLAESPQAQARGYPVVIVVEAPRELRLERLEKRGVPRDDAERRMAMQASDEQRRAIATYVIDNSGSPEALEQQVDDVWAKLRKQQAKLGRKRHTPSVRSWCARLRARLRLRPRR
jgi:dephospho-CoA kinase